MDLNKFEKMEALKKGFDSSIKELGDLIGKLDDYGDIAEDDDICWEVAEDSAMVEEMRDGLLNAKTSLFGE